ncbi:MASE1 domain-containing protein [Kitasatospora saccharophila]|uniref:MASE1 domain-containing protein n=1 Tax=Kitasatospora saccharophila TaxID=407973 RepID=UPI0036310C8E
MAAVLRNAKAGETAVAGLSMLGVALVYWAGGRLGLLTQVVVGGVHVTPLWPPTGVAVAGLLLLGLRVWPGIALGTLLVIAGFGAITPASFGIAAGNTLAPVVAVLLLARVGFRVELDRLRDGVALVFLGALASTLVSATAACLLLVSEGALAPHQFWPAWTAWWTGDAMGVLVITPCCWRCARPGCPATYRRAAGRRPSACWRSPSSPCSRRPAARSPCSSWSCRW